MIILLKISTQEGAALLLTFCLWLLKENMGIAASKAAISNISIASRAGRWNRFDYGPPPTSRAGHPFLKRRQNKIKRQQQILESHKARAGELLLAGWRVRLSACTAPGVGDHVRLLSGKRQGEMALKQWNRVLSEVSSSEFTPILAVDCVESRRFRVRWFGDFFLANWWKWNSNVIMKHIIAQSRRWIWLFPFLSFSFFLETVIPWIWTLNVNKLSPLGRWIFGA